MNPNGTPYTNPYGQTPQATQLASGQPNAGNSQAPSVSVNSSDQELNNAYAGAAQNLSKANSPDTRQALVNNYGLPQMQQNYDQLAQQLFNYDAGVLNPKFAGTNPGTPSDALSFGNLVQSSPLALTQGGLNNPVDQVLSMFSSNPKYGYSAQTDQANSLLGVLSALNSKMGATLGLAGTKNRSDVQSATDILSAISDIIGKKADIARTEATNKTDLQKTLLSLGLASVDDNGNIVSNTSGQSVDALASGNDRQAAQDYYNSLPASSPLRQKIANGWKSAHGNNLFPGALNDKSQEQLSNTVDLLNRVQRVLNVYQKYGDKVPQGLMGSYMKMLIQNKIPGTPLIGDITGANSIPKDLQQAITDMIAMRGQGEREIIGGRLTGYLLDVLGSAFPGIDNMADLTRSQLQTLQTGLNNKLKVFSKSSGYNSPEELLGAYNQTMESPISSGGGANRSQIVNNLKGKGYSDDQIHAYLRAKGIDK